MSDNLCPVCGCDEPRPIEDALRAEITRLTLKLAAAQAREARLREALIKIRDWDDCMPTAEKTAIKALRDNRP